METTHRTALRAETGAEQRTLLRNVYLWMTMALVLTGLAAYQVASSPAALEAIFTQRGLLWGLILGELALVIGLTALLHRMSFLTATLLFIAYAVLNGVTLSAVFAVYTPASITSTFLVTAGTFGAMALYGSVTQRDLTSWGSLGLMTLIGILIATVVNIFLRSSALYWIITFAGVLIFTGLTAYDAQKIKQMIRSREAVDETAQKLALLGALSLYLDFINLFLYLLRLLGDRK